MKIEDVVGRKLLDEAELRGISRRDFLKYCTATAALFGISEMEFAAGLAEAVEPSSGKPPVIWIEALACAGCTISLAQSLNPPASSIILDKISLRFHATIMAAAGHQAESVRDETIKKGGYILVFEGAIPSADDRYWRHGEHGGRKLFEEAARNASMILAVGACSAFGGIPRATPSKGISVTEALKNAKIQKPVINISTCPVHPDHLAGTIMYVLVTGKIPKLDSKGRPDFYFGEVSMHDNCRRRKHFDAGEFLMDWNDLGQKDWCLLMKGCKGPLSFIDCTVRRWNDGINFCLDCGGLCQACGEPTFYDKVTPLYTAEETTLRNLYAKNATQSSVNGGGE